MVSPFLAYNFSELIESHAVDTYSEFLETNSELLKSLPPTPQVWPTHGISRNRIRLCGYASVERTLARNMSPPHGSLRASRSSVHASPGVFSPVLFFTRDHPLSRRQDASV